MSIPCMVTPYWKFNSAGELLAGGLPVSFIAARYGSPLFIYDTSILEKKLSILRDVLPARFDISYSVKANPNPAILRFFIDRGCGLEIASAGEFNATQSIGCPPENMIFAGPGKTEGELEVVIANGIGEIHAESLLEIERIDAISRKLQAKMRVAIRVNPSEDAQGGAMLMGGKSAPFGIDEEQLPSIIDRLAEYPNIELTGIHLFVGTQILDAELLLAQYKKALEIYRNVAGRVHFPLRTLDFGGGLGIPYFAGDTELDLDRFGDALRELMADVENEGYFAETRFMIEPGRFLVGEAGIYVARINDIKTSRGKKYLILDGGMNHHLAASGNLGQVVKRNFPMAIAAPLDEGDTEIVDVVGPLCTPLDTLGRSVELPRARVGDLLVIFQSGAYARSASPLGFLSHPTPPEVWIEKDEHYLVRERGSLVDYVHPVRSAAMSESG